MVTINATIVVLLVMFLAFLWLMHRFIFKPLLAHMDAREGQIAEDKRMAAEAASEAEQLEDEYATRVSKIHREANLRLQKAHREAQETHLAHIAEYRAQAESEIKALAKSLQEELSAQEDQISPLAEDIHTAMAAKLALE